VTSPPTGPTGPPSPAEAFFDAIAGRYERAYALPASASRLRMARVIEALPSPPARVLDLGVGTGRELSALLDAGFAPTGLDASAAMLERCARRARPVPLVRADFWQAPLPFDRAAFDAVLALHGTLAHPPDVDAVGRLARELARVVRAGGAFIAEVPSPAWLERLDTALLLADRRVRRTGRATCVYEDLVTGASIEATLLDEADWRAALSPDWDARVEPVDEVEWLVVARRT
jgi:SAM-dependent methyltransferase